MKDNWVFELHMCQMKKKQALRITTIYILKYICILYFYIFLIIGYILFISHGQNWVFVNCMAQMIIIKVQEEHQYISIFYLIRYLKFKSSIVHCSFMENIFLVKIQKNVNERKHT